MLPKIKSHKLNLPGIKLRAKSQIHSDIINKFDGRRKNFFASSAYDSILENKGKELWPNFGRFKFLVSDKKLIKVDISRLKIISQKANRKLDLMFLGPGKGAEIRYFNDILKSSKIVANLDSYALSDSLTEKTKKMVRNNHYPKKITEKDFFEHMNHLKFVNKYDYVYSYLGVGYHTSNLEVSLLKVASMLRVGGFARIYVWRCNFDSVVSNINQYLKLSNKQEQLKLILQNDYIIIERVK